MRRLLLPLLVVLPAAAGEPLRLAASVEGGLLVVHVEGPLPAGAVLRVQAFREVSTLSVREPVHVVDERAALSGAGRLDARFPVGDALAPPGHYRVRVEFEPAGQYPGVLKEVGADAPEPGEARLLVGMDSEAFLDEILGEQAFLEEALDRVEAFLKGWEAHAAASAADPKAGIPAWEAWRTGERAYLDELILRGRKEAERCYPGTYAGFAEDFVFYGIYQTESRAFLNAGKGTTGAAPGLLKGGSRPAPEALAPFRILLQRETLHYRLEAADALARAVRQERQDQAASPEPARWARKRAVWDRILERLAARTERLPVKDHADAVPAALRAWIDAEEAARFNQGPPPAPAETAFGEACAALRKDLAGAGRRTP